MNYINIWNDPFPPKNTRRDRFMQIFHQMISRQTELHLVVQKMHIIISAPVEDPCMPGYQPVGESCAKCPFGFYKSTIGNLPCTLCPEFSSTLILGATLPSQCGKYFFHIHFLLKTGCDHHGYLILLHFYCH